MGGAISSAEQMGGAISYGEQEKKGALSSAEERAISRRALNIFIYLVVRKGGVAIISYL